MSYNHWIGKNARMAKIQINDLKIKTIIGTHSWERKTKQQVIVNVLMEYDSLRSQKSDNLVDSVDYRDVSQRVIEVVESSKNFLLERLADVILNVVCQNPRITKAIVRIDKPSAVKVAKSISVEVSFP